MKARARLTVDLGDPKEAEAVALALSPDDEGYVRTRCRGATLTAVASADAPLSLLHTLDDYLACLSVAEKAAREARPRVRGRRRRA
ncbi:MAG: hypothetical protein A3K68_03625 [Euryarchaeota archaeon RBG_16_68_13]|nr:MAG: hypothetical protein A3K68_03625 [Euryarchaeota archaeon RBG_16_68_13]